LNESLRDSLWSRLIDVGNEGSIPICICYKDISSEDIESNDIFSDSGGLVED